MKRIVKALAFALSFAMLVSLAPMSVLAGEQTNSEQTTEVQNILTDDFEALEENTAESETEKAAAQGTGDSESSENELSGGETIAAGGTYTLKAGATGTITIATTEAVTIAGAGAEWDENYNITSTAYSGLGFAASVAGINLTLKDMYIKNTDDTQPIVDVTGTENKLGIEGTVLLEQEGVGAGTYTAIHVSKENDITINGTGTLYLYKKSGGAGVGGNSGELNGDITFGDSKSSLKVFMKGTKQGAVIGAGTGASQETETPGFVKFVEGEYNLISNSKGAVIGGAAGSDGATDGTTVYVEKNANININTDYSGAAIGGGGYNGGNDASGGKLYIDGGSLRVYIDKNAAGNTTGWMGKKFEEGLNDASITAQRLNSKGENVYRLVLDTSAVEGVSAPYTVTVDGEEAYIGGNHHYGFIQEGLDKDEQLTVTSTPSNWYSITEPNLYLYVTGKDHKININGVDVQYYWDEVTESFSTTKLNPVNVVVTDGTNNITEDAEITLSKGIVYTYTEETYPGKYEAEADEATISETTASDNVSTENDDSTQTSTKTAPHQAFNVTAGHYTLTIKADGYYGSSFSFQVADDGTITGPNGDKTGSVYDYVKGTTFTIPLTTFTPSTNTGAWDGKTLDVSWYTEDGDNFEITTAEQLAGLAAIVNGIYNVEITTIKDGDKKYTPEEYAALETRKIRPASSQGTTGDNNKLTTDDYWYGVKSDGKTPSDFNGKSIYIKADIDMGGYKANGAWTGARYMTIGGQSLMHYIDYGEWKSDGYTHLGSSFNGKFFGEGHIIKNIYCDRYAAGGNFGDSSTVGLIGRLGNHDGDSADISAVNPTVRDIAVSGYVYARRSVGGVVGKIGQTSATMKNDGSVGGIIENCLNFCEVHNTDAKGCGGIVGAGWNKGRVKNCANFGYIWTTYHCPTGGISGSNEVKLINCYNVGIIKAAQASYASYAMAIGTNNGGASTVTNCYWLTGTPDSKAGYYKGAEVTGEKEITDNYNGTSYTASEYMKSANFTSDINGTGRTWVTPESSTLIYQFMEEQGFEGYPVPRIFTEDKTTLVSIEKVSDPETLSYIEGQTFDTEGLEIKASYSDGTSEVLEDYNISNTAALTTKDTVITISGNEGGKDYRYEFNITVAKKECIDIVIVKKPDSLIYAKNEELDLAGLRVGAKYTNFPDKVVNIGASDYTAEPSTDESGNEYILVSYTYNEKTFTKTIPIIRMEAEAPEPNEGYYEITCEEQLAWFANQVTAKGEVELNAKIMNDFSTGELFDGIGSSLKVYKGKIDGNNCTITINKETKSAFGFVNYADGAEIKNLTIAGTIKQTSTYNTAAFVAQLYTSNITDSDDQHLTVIENCKNTAEITSKGSNVGGFIGNVNRGSLTVKNCVNEGNISGTQYVGGIVGTANAYANVNGETTIYVTKKLEIIDCENKGDISAKTGYVGGIAGNFDSRNSEQSSKISGCKNNGTVSGGSSVGGIVGYIYGLANEAENIPTIEKCGNDGAVNGTESLGGIVGYNNGRYLKIDSCYNAGTIAGTGGVNGKSNVGGIIGTSYTDNLTNVYNLGSVSCGVQEKQSVQAASGVGGIIGASNNTKVANLANAYNAGTVTATGSDASKAPSAGAIIGYTAGDFTATNVYVLEGTAENICGEKPSSKTFTINDDTVKTSDELKGLAENLGENFKENSVESYHGGYPAFLWDCEAGHVFEDVEVITEPTCTTAGEMKTQCEYCGFVSSRTIDATGHKTELKNAKEATCTENGYTGDEVCTVCKETVKKGTVITALGHKTELKNAKEATCTENGYTGDEVCTVCKETIKTGTVIQAKGHTEVVDKAVAPTCTSTGLTEGKHCSVCGEVIVKQDVIKALGHTEEIIPGTPATYTSTGLTEGIKCTVCKEILKKQEVIPMLMTDGWHLIDGKYYFYQNNEVQKGWIESGSKKYYTDTTTGVMATGFKKIDGNWYYFKPGNSGLMLTGFQKVNGKWYYFNPTTGKMATGFTKISGKWYYFKPGDSGMMLTGFQKIGGKWYYFKTGDSGMMLTGWQKINGKWYYFKTGDSGMMLTGWQKIGGSWYYFKTGDSGMMLTGWQKISGKWYYFNTSSGKMLTGTQKIGSKTYVFNSSGVWIK